MSLLHRAKATQRKPLRFRINGVEAAAMEGDTVLTGILTLKDHLRISEFTGAPRSGLCLMGACQDCWVSDADGNRFRACSTLLVEGMDIVVPSSMGSRP